MSKDNRKPFTYKGVEVLPRGIFGPRQSFGRIDEYKEINGRVYSRWWRIEFVTDQRVYYVESKAAARKKIDDKYPTRTDSPKAKGNPCG